MVSASWWLRCARLLALVAVGSILGPRAAGAQVTDEEIADHLRRNLESASVPLELQIGGERVLATLALPTFYEQRVYRPAFVTGQGPTKLADELAKFVDGVWRDGLDPREYHLDRVRELLEQGQNTSGSSSVSALADLDLLLTDAFLMIGAHLVSGRVDPATLDREWLAVHREADIVQLLTSAITSGDIRAALASLQPAHAGYFRLRDVGERYFELAAEGGWQTISSGPPLRIGDRGERVGELRQRVRVTDGPLPETMGGEPIFDEQLEMAVKRFQTRHGLAADGVVGSKTLSALNVTATERLQQIYLNLERWRWLPQSLGDSYVLVNVPAFDLRVVEGGVTILEMRVAVGRRYRRTPVFSDTIRYLVFNPYWEIPTSIAVNDKLPEIRSDPTYLEKQGIRVISGWGGDQREIEPSTIDWGSLGAGNFPYRLRQDPGPMNALGRVKFMFPNRFNVYLHDTPGREVFGREERDVSSGCIRLEAPFELAHLLLRDTSGWQSGSIDEYLNDYRERTVRLARPWPVHLLHWTAWVDETMRPQFRTDLYNRDQKLAAALIFSSSADSRE